MNKFKFDVKKYNIDPQNNCNLQNHHTFHPEEKMVNLVVVRRRERFGGLSSYYCTVRYGNHSKSP